MRMVWYIDGPFVILNGAERSEESIPSTQNNTLQSQLAFIQEILRSFLSRQRRSPEDDPVGSFKIRQGGIHHGEQYAPTCRKTG